MDVPTDLKDWWIYLFPGILLLLEILFLYDSLVIIMPELFKLKFDISTVWSFSDTKIAVFLLILISVGLITGSIIEGLSYRFFNKYQQRSPILLDAFNDFNDNEDFIQQLLSDPKLFPEEYWKGSFEAFKKDIDKASDFMETQLLRDAEDDESESLNETAVAITFTQSFFLSFIMFSFIILWLFIHEYFGITIISILFYVIFLRYLWNDQRTLTKIYWEKTYHSFTAHLWKKKSDEKDS